MPGRSTLRPALIAGVLFMTSLAPAVPAADYDPTRGALYDTVAALDQRLFDSFNHCSDPARLAEHISYWDAQQEFFHDNAGLMRGQEAMATSVRNNVCGKFRRELLPDTLRVYPVKDFGAIAQGSHRFCSFGGQRCEGIAEFVLVWQQTPDGWRVLRALSYGHRPLAD